ncbi:MAG: hypothetical protein JWO06_194 [Bacteroidota bacterium]|nr:hypothetical protein [Bacteroidota bacterium]
MSHIPIHKVAIAHYTIVNNLLALFSVNTITMKKTTSPQDIDEYVAGFPADVQVLLQQVRATIKKAAPKAQEAIKYGIPTFTLNGNLVHFGGFKNHIGFYPTPRVLEEFKKDLAGYKGAKGSVQFPINKPMPLSLISRIVKFRVKKITEKEKTKTSKK